MPYSTLTSVRIVQYLLHYIHLFIHFIYSYIHTYILSYQLSPIYTYSTFMKLTICIRTYIHTVYTHAFIHLQMIFSGENFQYKEDAPTTNNNSTDSATSGTTNEVKSVSYPDLESVLARGWGEIRSRFFPLSSVYVKDRLINCFRFIIVCSMSH